jgi:hypothetical protein
LTVSQEATVTVCRRQEFAKSTACLSVFLLFDGRVGLNFLVNCVFKQSSLHHRILGSPLCVKTCAEFGPFTSQRDELGDGNGQTLSLAPSRNANRQTELQRLEMVALRRPTGANCCMNSKMDLPRIRRKVQRPNSSCCRRDGQMGRVHAGTDTRTKNSNL